MLLQKKKKKKEQSCSYLFVIVPSAAPGNFRLGSSSPLSLDVSWDAIPVEQQHGKLLGYYVYYKIRGSAEMHKRSVWPNQTTDKIPGLEYKIYVVSIAGYTAVGVGKLSAAQSKIPNQGGQGSTKLINMLI